METTSTRPLRVGLVGAGFVVPFHLRGWGLIDDIDVVSITSRSRAKAETVAEDFDIPHVYGSLEELLSAEPIDILDICTPPEAHLHDVTMAASAGVHVICQKPVASDLETARKIQQLSHVAGIRLMVHENFRFRPWDREAKVQLDAGAIGTPIYCRSDLRMPGTVTTE